MSWRSIRARILSATSLLAMIAAAGGDASACSPAGTRTGSGTFSGFSNSGSLDCISITNLAIINGNVSNGATGVLGPPGAPAPGTLSIDNSTINGAIQNSGHINASGGTLNGISVTGGSVVTKGIINNSTGTISASGNGNLVGINVNQSSFSGNITNNGLITVTSSNSAAGISVGGGAGPQPLAPNSLSTVKTTSTPGGITPPLSTSLRGRSPRH